MSAKIKYHALLALAACTLAFSCKKDKHIVEESRLTDKNLSACAPQTTCQYLFTEQADVSANGALKPGNYRVLWFTQLTGGNTTTLFIKAPMQGNTFKLDKNDILAGKVQYYQDCAVCNLVALKPVDGHVLAINKTPGNRADNTRWLLEADIILQGLNNPGVKDTLHVKQYFNANFVID